MKLSFNLLYEETPKFHMLVNYSFMFTVGYRHYPGADDNV